MNIETEHNIVVEVETNYVEGQSEPDNERYVFSYTITIRNEGGQPAQLLSRHWIITDAHGNIQEVKGEGVVGERRLTEEVAVHDLGPAAACGAPIEAIRPRSP